MIDGGVGTAVIFEPVLRFRAKVASHQAEELLRLTEPPAVRAARRDLRLRGLLGHARRHSSWYRARLADIDIDSVGGDDLSSLPTMTKTEVMDNWDALVCDPKLTLARVTEHLDTVENTGPCLLDDRYVPMVTGGSTGTRGVFVWDLDDLCVHLRSMGRTTTWNWNAAQRQPVNRPPVRAGIYGVNAMHLGATLAWLTDGNIRSAGTPVPELVDWLNQLQPELLGAYSSVLGRLADEAIAGRPRIAPVVVTATAEPVDDLLYSRVQQAWHRGLNNLYSLTESPGMAVSYPGRTALTLTDDAAIIEVVDAAGRPVPPGVAGDKILLTVLTNRTLPLVRYEVTDQLSLLADKVDDRPWTGQLLSPPVGRTDDWLSWSDNIELHPHVVRSILAAASAVIEYQVHQTVDGLDIAVVSSGPIDTDDLVRRLRVGLVDAGFVAPVVSVHVVPALPRHATSAKLRRFIPLKKKIDEAGAPS
ncbi:MAG: phenylacetate--CoA ligase family protein [Acidimicrobiales bacterium]